MPRDGARCLETTPLTAYSPWQRGGASVHPNTHSPLPTRPAPGHQPIAAHLTSLALPCQCSPHSPLVPHAHEGAGQASEQTHPLPSPNAEGSPGCRLVPATPEVTRSWRLPGFNRQNKQESAPSPKYLIYLTICSVTIGI